MLPLGLPSSLNVLCLGAHADDIEIGCGGTLLSWAEAGCRLRVCWGVGSATPERVLEQQQSAERYFQRFESGRLVQWDFPDTKFPSHGDRLKDEMRALYLEFPADLVFTHRLEDRHQDHRTMAELTWNIWRDSLVLEYEIPKWEGDLGQPQAFVSVSTEAAESKVRWLDECYASQAKKDWFDRDLFLGLMRIRGAECRSASRFAEAFHVRKCRLGV